MKVCQICNFLQIYNAILSQIYNFFWHIYDFYKIDMKKEK